jgi:PAS domain S-box-containing protein
MKPRTDISQLVEALAEPAVVLDLEGRIAYFNRRARAALGVTEPGQRAPWELLGRDGRPVEPVEAEVRRTGAEVERLMLVRARAAAPREMLVRALGLRGDDGAVTGVLVRFHDTPRDEPGDPQEHAHWFERSDDLLCLATPAGVVLRINQGATRMLGWAREALLGSGFTALLHPEDAVRTAAAMASRQSGGELVTRCLHQDGGWRLLSLTVSPETSPTLGEVASVRAVDLTESLRREEELRASREQLAEAQDIAHMATVARDYRTGAIEVNPRLAGMLGLPEGEPIERFVGSRLTAEAKAGLRDALQRGLQDEPTSMRLRVELPRGVREFKLWARPHRDSRGEIVRLVGVVQDVTDELRLSAQLRLAERMASVGTLAAGVAHEINNPLSFIIANLNTARADLGRVKAVPGLDWGDLQAALAEASQGAERVRDVVAGLRAFANVDDTATTPCDLPRVLEAVLNLSKNETRHRARVVAHLERVPTVIANEARLGQVFLNLVLNAAQAITDGHVERNTITVATRSVDGCVLVTVSDTGSGIAPEHLARIFDPFFTTRGNRGGSGLGLFIAQGIVRELAGELLVDSRVGVGTTFTVRLPVTPASGGERLAAPASHPRVLVVDDDALVLRSLERMLRATCQPTTASSANEALQLLATTAFDVVLCDLNLPGLSGMALFEKVSPALRANLVFVTGGACSDEAQAFLDQQGARVLYKPFTSEEVLSLVRALAPH